MQSSLLIQGLHVNFDSTKAKEASQATPNLSMLLQPTIPLYSTTVTTVPEYLEYILPQTSQVCNCDEIGFDPNGSCRKVVFTYKSFSGYRMWRTHT